MQIIRIVRDGREIAVPAEKIGGRLWFHYENESHLYEPEAAARASSGAGRGSDQVEAPMPGKILRVEVKSGDAVAAGRPLVVMEAMKMEYTLAAAVSGKVVSVACREGDQVKLGQLLIKLEAAPSG